RDAENRDHVDQRARKGSKTAASSNCLFGWIRFGAIEVQVLRATAPAITIVGYAPAARGRPSPVAVRQPLLPAASSCADPARVPPAAPAYVRACEFGEWLRTFPAL